MWLATETIIGRVLRGGVMVKSVIPLPVLVDVVENRLSRGALVY
jgi:hypothetical protein